MADEMPNHYDLCIVGAGMIGSAAARHATNIPGYKVCLIGPEEPKVRKLHGSGIYGAYYDQGRITRSTATDPVWAQLSQRSIDRYRKLEEDTGIKFYTEAGCLTVGSEGLDFVESTYTTAKQMGVKVHLLTPVEARQKFPYIFFDDSHKTVYEQSQAGYINPRQMVAAEQTAAHLQGCDIIKAIVNEVKPVKRADGSEMYEIVTDHSGVVYADKVLVATGAFYDFRKLLPSGVHPDDRLLTQSVLLAEVAEEDLTTLSNMPCVLYRAPESQKRKQMKNNMLTKFGCYILPPIQYPDGKFYIKIGHGSQFEKRLYTEAEVGRWYNKDPPSYVKIVLEKMLINIFPGFTPKSLLYDTCVTMHTVDRRPFIDLVNPTFGVALGGNGYAAKCCDEFGRVAVELVRHGKWTDDLPQEHFRLKLKANI